MKKEIADRWVAALRSGAYKQGQGFLKKTVDGETRHCCLGVLCEILADEVFLIIKKNPFDPGVYVFQEKDALANIGVLPMVIMDYAHIKTDLGSLEGLQGVSLAAFNDRGSSFTQIADIIESQYKTL